MKNSSPDSSINSSTPTTNTIDFNAILRALLAKQGQNIKTSIEKTSDNNTDNSLCSSSSIQSITNSQLQSDSTSTTAS